MLETIISKELKIKMTPVILVFLLALIFPQLVQAQEFDELLCQTDSTEIGSGVIQDFYNGTITDVKYTQDSVNVTCAFLQSGEKVTFSFETNTSQTETLPAPGEEPLQSGDNPLLTSDVEYKSSYNCHSFTLQTWQRLFGFDVGVNESTWINDGNSFRDVIQSLGTLIVSAPINNEDELMNALQEGDALLFIRIDPNTNEISQVEHSGIAEIDPDTGELIIVGKDGSATQIHGSIGATAERYLLDPTVDRVEIYRFGKE